jgi:diguanylate cyclase (GGDEF)-like protein
VDRAHRTGEPLVLAFLDVDQLKRVNDLQGHASGDHLLSELGAAMRQSLRSYDVAVRYGGDEFVCALPGAHLADAERRFAELGEVLANAIVGASVSVGLAELRGDESLEQAIGRADREMYERRRARRARPDAK